MSTRDRRSDAYGGGTGPLSDPSCRRDLAVAMWRPSVGAAEVLARGKFEFVKQGDAALPHPTHVELALLLGEQPAHAC